MKPAARLTLARGQWRARDFWGADVIIAGAVKSTGETLLFRARAEPLIFHWWRVRNPIAAGASNRALSWAFPGRLHAGIVLMTTSLAKVAAANAQSPQLPDLPGPFSVAKGMLEWSDAMISHQPKAVLEEVR